MEAIFNTPSYVRPTRRVIIGTCSALRVPQHRDDDDSGDGPASPHQRVTSIFRGATSPVAQVQNPRRSTSGRGAGASSTYTVQRSSNLLDDHRIPTDCGRGVQEESSSTGDVPIDTGTPPKIPSYNRALTASEGGAYMESYIPSGISYSDFSTDVPISYTPYGPDSRFNPDPRSPRHVINRGTTCSGKEAHNVVKFTPQKPACHSNHRSTHAIQTEARHRQPPKQMGMAPYVNRRRVADSLPESLTARKANPQGFHALPRGKPCGSRYNFSPSTTAAMDFPPSSPSGHSVSRGYHRVSYGNPTNSSATTTS